MGERLLSVGLDVGTTSTQMILSELTVENRASGFSVPEMAITERKIRYQSPVHFTPLLDNSRVDGQALRELVAAEYAAAGISRAQVDTGAVIVTGETSRKENAAAVLESLSEFAGDFVVATAGPHLESVLAAKGAGAVAYSRDTGKKLVHMDIGGGTANLAWIDGGKIVKTGCLNVGGRLVRMDRQGQIQYVSPVLGALCKLKPGDTMTYGDARELAAVLTKALVQAAGLDRSTELRDRLWTKEAGVAPELLWAGEDVVISFSGGVADCIETDAHWLAYGDLGVALGHAIRESLLCRGQYRLGAQTIRATVIGAGCHSAMLSGSTVYHRGIGFPLKNLPVVCLDGEVDAQTVRRATERAEGECVLWFRGMDNATYDQITALAEAITTGVNGRILVAMEADMAKALGQAMGLRCPQRPCLCIDRVRILPESYLDVGAPVGPCLPVVVKTMVLGG